MSDENYQKKKNYYIKFNNKSIYPFGESGAGKILVSILPIANTAD
jgi:DNA replication protein DnaC